MSPKTSKEGPEAKKTTLIERLTQARRSEIGEKLFGPVLTPAEKAALADDPASQKWKARLFGPKPDAPIATPNKKAPKPAPQKKSRGPSIAELKEKTRLAGDAERALNEILERKYPKEATCLKLVLGILQTHIKHAEDQDDENMLTTSNAPGFANYVGLDAKNLTNILISIFGRDSSLDTPQEIQKRLGAFPLIKKIAPFLIRSIWGNQPRRQSYQDLESRADLLFEDLRTYAPELIDLDEDMINAIKDITRSINNHEQAVASKTKKPVEEVRLSSDIIAEITRRVLAPKGLIFSTSDVTEFNRAETVYRANQIYRDNNGGLDAPWLEDDLVYARPPKEMADLSRPKKKSDNEEIPVTPTNNAGDEDEYEEAGDGNEVDITETLLEDAEAPTPIPGAVEAPPVDDDSAETHIWNDDRVPTGPRTPTPADASSEPTDRLQNPDDTTETPQEIADKYPGITLQNMVAVAEIVYRDKFVHISNIANELSWREDQVLSVMPSLVDLFIVHQSGRGYLISPLITESIAKLRDALPSQSEDPEDDVNAETLVRLDGEDLEEVTDDDSSAGLSVPPTPTPSNGPTPPPVPPSLEPAPDPSPLTPDTRQINDFLESHPTLRPSLHTIKDAAEATQDDLEKLIDSLGDDEDFAEELLDNFEASDAKLVLAIMNFFKISQPNEVAEKIEQISNALAPLQMQPPA